MQQDGSLSGVQSPCSVYPVSAELKSVIAPNQDIMTQYPSAVTQILVVQPFVPRYPSSGPHSLPT